MTDCAVRVFSVGARNDCAVRVFSVGARNDITRVRSYLPDLTRADAAKRQTMPSELRVSTGKFRQSSVCEH
jgi:hypothetical protein